MTKMHQSQDFCDDSPKKNPWTEDKLGFRPFAERLFKAILKINAPNGYVIGLHGAWGSGKSTALNFVQAFLNKHNQELQSETGQIHVIDFRPWIVSGHQDLISAFFKVVSETLGGTRTWWGTWKQRFLNVFRDTTDPLLDAAATVGVVIDPSGGAASGAVVNVAKTSLKNLVNRWLTEPSLQAAYDRLTTALASSGQRFLVIIDDIDRLEKEEMRAIMQMVKTVGQLPNVIYLLAYDREIVWSTLDNEATVNPAGPSFAEKIVQHEIELPRPSRNALLSILDSELSFLGDTTPGDLRWHDLVQNGVHRWVLYPRDSLRLANAVKFSWPALEGEIDPQDLLIMEGLRLFDDKVFDWIRWNRDFLFAQGRFMFADDDLKSALGKELRESLPAAPREQIIELLCDLFPGRAKFIRGKEGIGGENRYETVKRRGVGCEAGYDAYFSLFPSPNAIPKTTIDAAIERLDDEEFLITVFERYIDKKDESGGPLVSNLLEELRYRFRGRGAAAPTLQLLNAMFRVGESILAIRWDSGFLDLSPRGQFSNLVHELLEAWGQRKARDHLIAAFNKSESPAVCADVFVDLCRELGLMQPEGKSGTVISKRALKPLGERLLALIEAAAAKGKLEDAPFYFDIIRCWRYLSGPEKPKAWIHAGINSNATFLAKLAMGMLVYSTSTSGRKYSMRERPDEELYDLTALQAACRKHLATGNYTKDDLSRVAALAQGVQRCLADPDFLRPDSDQPSPL